MLFAFLLTKVLLTLLGHSENKPEKIKLAEKYFPDAELIWSETFEGKMIDFEIAEKSGHVVIGAVKDSDCFVYFFSPDGELLWRKGNDKHSIIDECGGVGVDISENGKTIGIHWGGDFEHEEIQAYDISGEKLGAKDHGITGVSVKVSPKGGYVKHTNLYDRTVNKVVLREILKGFPIEKLWDGKRYRDISKFDFVSEEELAILFDNVLYIYSFPEGKIRWKSKELDFGRYWANITPLGNQILVSGGRNLYYFDKDGALNWEKDFGGNLYYHTISSSSDNRYLVIHRSRKIYLFDTKTGEMKLQSGVLKSQISVKNLLCLENKVFLSGYTGGSMKDVYKGYWTYILHFDDNFNIVNESWKKGLVIGTPESQVIAVYESDATGEDDDTGTFNYENSTSFTINILKIRN